MEETNKRTKAPWIITRDLNELYCYNDKKGGNRVTYGRMKRLNEFCLRNKFENIPIVGNQYTWKRKCGNGMIFEKLDRGLAR